MKERYTEITLLKEIERILECESNISETEKDILIKAKQSLVKNVYFNKVIFELKQSFSLLAINNKLNKEVQSLFVEISRQNPTTGATSKWNFLIK